MRIDLLWIGKTKAKPLRQLEADYLSRVSRFWPAAVSVIAEQNRTDAHQAASASDKESRAIEKKLKDDARVVVLDEVGQQMSSPQLAELLGGWMDSGIPAAAFIAGGFAGVPPAIRERADHVLSLSRLTLPHELARVVFLEQLYRAATILKGLPYHK